VEGGAREVSHRGDGGAVARQICPSRISSWESLKRPSCRVKCLPINSSRMTRSLRDCVSGEVARAVIRDAVVRFSSCQVK
jgi:hypothetical protein